MRIGLSNVELPKIPNTLWPKWALVGPWQPRQNLRTRTLAKLHLTKKDVVRPTR
jgi:hypothetical protein